MISTFFDECYSDDFKEIVSDFANALWDILSRAKTYSFAKDPLPIFYLLHAAYCDYDISYLDEIDLNAMKNSNLRFLESSDRAKLLELFPENCTRSLCEDWEVIDDFCSMLNVSTTGTLGDHHFEYQFRGAKYKYIHPFIVDFFIKKYIELCDTEHELSEIFMYKLWYVINENGEPGHSSDYYIPYSGLSAIALYDINNSYSYERVSYYCEEDDTIFSIIAKVRLCAYGHNFNIVKTSSEIAKDRFLNSGEDRIAMVSVPPFDMKIRKDYSNGKSKYIDVAEDVIEKFLSDKRFETAYLVFPMSFATDSKFANIRKRLVEDKLIRHIVKIPEGSFMTSSIAGVILCLDKSDKSNVVKINFDDSPYSEISFLEIINNDYSLYPDLYLNCVAQISENAIQYQYGRSIFRMPHHWDPNPQDSILDDSEMGEEYDSESSNSFNSDLMHCLGPVFNRINNIADENMADNSNSSILKLIKDNLGYMSRIIKSFGVNFDNYAISKRETNVNEFFSNFYTSSQNCMNSSFAIEYSSDVDDETTFDIDEDIVRIMLDTILDNAYRHGFKKKRLPDAKLYISTSCVSINQREYVLIEVANNGAPLSEDFTIDKFIARGEHCGESGNTGLGGHHVYNIVKLHNGFLYVTKSAKWSVIFEILIPAEYLGDKDFNNLKEYYNATKCV